jgi:hypothetical protein
MRLIGCTFTSSGIRRGRLVPAVPQFGGYGVRNSILKIEGGHSA